MASRAGGGNAKDSSSPESGGADFAAISVDGCGVGGSIIRGILISYSQVGVREPLT